jgi:8-amino-7-oxononanoate synthase
LSFDRRIAARLQALEARGLGRQLPPVSAREGVVYRLGEREVVGFCSNDYLGLADEQPADGTPSPSGAGGSRLICGDLPLHRAAERKLAALVGAADAVLFPSGFQLNVGVLPLVVESDDLVYSDQLNHASLIDGLRLSRASTRVLPHGMTPPAAAASASSLRWWVVESIFSMDGDQLDAQTLVQFTEQGGCSYVDEAHALGLFAGGRGLFGTQHPLPTLLVGTLSKAFGCAGAFVAASADACHYIRTRARSFVFTTGTSPAVLPRIVHAIDCVTGPEGDRRREALWTNIARLAERLGAPGPMPSPILPIVVGDNLTAVTLAQGLLDRGFHVQPIRPPTVPPDTARLRITVTASHTPAQIDALAVALRELFELHDLPLRFDRVAPPSRSPAGRSPTRADAQPRAGRA